MSKIIAEIGWNHMGNMKLAETMIRAAAKSGAWACKFQIFSTDRLKPGPWDSDGRRKIYEEAQLTPEKVSRLKNICDDEGVTFFASVFSIPDAMMLVEVDNTYVKIASAESRNHELLDYVNQNFKNIILSTGSSTLQEIEDSIAVVDRLKSRLYVMHCVATYPCPPEAANLTKIDVLKRYNNGWVGFSDHCEGIEVAKISLEHDPVFIEKHFTTNRELPGRDNKYSILPHELLELTNYIELRKEIKMYRGSDFQESEAEIREIYSGRFDKS